MPGDTSVNAFTGPETPVEGQNARRDPERDHVRNGVELETEVARRFRHPGNAAVQAIEYVSDADENSGVIPITTQSRDNRVIPAEDVFDREKARNDRKAPSDPRLIPNVPLGASFQH